MSRDLAISFFKEARDYRMQGNYELAKDSMTRAISYDPTCAEIFYENGKLNFQLQNYITSINSYMAFTHLKLNDRVKQLNGELEFPDREQSEKFYNELPENIRNILPNKAASYILEDGDICNHIAHSYIASQNIVDEDIEKHMRVYHATLISYLITDMTLEQFNVDYNDFKKMNEEIFIPNGRVLLLENINWNEIGNDDVLELYFK